MLSNWTIEGLDFDKAIAQPSAVHKVRHMKCGIKMAAALCSISEDTCHQMLVKASLTVDTSNMF